MTILPPAASFQPLKEILEFSFRPVRNKLLNHRGETGWCGIVARPTPQRPESRTYPSRIRVEGFCCPVMPPASSQGRLDIRKSKEASGKPLLSGDCVFISLPPINNIRCILAIAPLHIKVPWTPYPRHWRSGQMESNLAHCLGTQLKEQRLKLLLPQPDMAKRLGVSVGAVTLPFHS